MRYKKMMVLTIILTCLLAVSAVSAAENATDDIGGVDVESEDAFGFDDSNNDGANVGVSSDSPQEDATTKNIENSDFEKSEISNNELNSDSKVKDGDVQRNDDYELTVDSKVDGDSVDIEVRLPKNISNPVLIDVNGVGYYANATNGKAKLHLDDLPKGGYDVVATYIGDDYYGQRSNTTAFVIYNTTLGVQVIAQNVTVGENSLFIIDTIDKFKGNVSIKVEDKVLYNGNVKLLIVTDKLTGGDKTATFVFYGDDRYDELTLDNVKFRVSKLKTQLNANEVIATYNIYNNLVISLKDITGNPLIGLEVTVNLNGGKTLITDKNGQISVSTKGLAPKTYTARVNFDGNANYAGSSAKIKVVVKKANPKLTAKAKSFKKSVKIKKYTVTLKTNKNKAMKKTWITLKVNKKTYKVKTNSKGKATFKITNLKKGTFKATVKYKGNKYYKKVTRKNVKIVVR